MISRDQDANDYRRTQEFSQTGTTGEQEAGGSIKIGTELGEGGDFSVLGKVELQGTSELLHDLAVNGCVSVMNGQPKS